jgi:oligopeptide/dipeptide ABC transporter ATP-binding protein
MLLEATNLSVDFATSKGILYAVRGVDLRLQEGELLGIVGESGSGKSVTAHALLRLIPGNGSISGGSVRYRGEDIFSFGREGLRSYRGGEVSMIFQEPGRSFDPIYSVGKAMEETIRAHAPDLDTDTVQKRSVELLKEVHIPFPEERLSNFPHQFSGGLLQRIMIALALASDPKVLIADEPTTALDVTIQAGIIDLLVELKHKRNLAIIFITHNLGLIGAIADRIAVMYHGLVLEQGPAGQVLNHPHHPYTRALLDSILPFGQHHSDEPLKVVRGTVPDPHRPEPGCPFAPRCPLVRDECTAAVPPLVEEAGREHRCVVPGKKERLQ